MRFTGAALLLGLAIAAAALQTSAQNRLPPDAPRPIDAVDSLWAEELTSMEIRDALRAGTTTIRTTEIGQKLAAYRAGITARAFRASQRRLRGH